MWSILTLKKISDKVVEVTVKENEQEIKCNVDCKYRGTKFLLKKNLTVEKLIYMQSKSGLTILVNLHGTIAMICSIPAVHFENFGSVFRTQANIYDWAFIAKIVSR